MILIADIMEELVDGRSSLTSPFLKTKILASKVGNSELKKWIDLELQGYSNEDEVPPYRICVSRLVGSWINGTPANSMKGTDLPLPASGYGSEWEKYFGKTKFRESIATLEAFTKNNEVTELQEPLPSDVSEIIADRIRREGNPYFSIIKASKRTAISHVYEVLSTLRSKLLDFMLKIDEEFGNKIDIDKLAEQMSAKQKIATIMNQTIINSGTGSVVNTGDHSSIHVSVQQGSFDQVEKILLENGVSKSDVKELKEIVVSEKPSKGQLGEKVKGWMRKMLSKAMDGTWKIGIAAAAKLLEEVIKQYYGN